MRNTKTAFYRSAFTLIELLVVVAIIVILIAVLLPSLAKARESAKNVKCMSNLKQIGTLLVMYSNEDSRGYLPPEGVNPGTHWYTKLQLAGYSNYQYDKSYICPSDQYLLFNTSYGINYYRTGYGTNNQAPAKFSAIESPASTLLCADGWGGQNSIPYGSSFVIWISTPVNGGIETHHQGGANVLLFDTHVEYVKVPALTVDRTISW